MGKHGFHVCQRELSSKEVQPIQALVKMVREEKEISMMASGNKKTSAPKGTKVSCIHPISTACRHAELKKYSDFSCILRRCNGRARRAYLSALPAQKRTFSTGPALPFHHGEALCSRSACLLFSFIAMSFLIALILPSLPKAVKMKCSFLICFIHKKIAEE